MCLDQYEITSCRFASSAMASLKSLSKRSRRDSRLRSTKDSIKLLIRFPSLQFVHHFVFEVLGDPLPLLLYKFPLVAVVKLRMKRHQPFLAVHKDRELLTWLRHIKPELGVNDSFLWRELTDEN